MSSFSFKHEKGQGLAEYAIAFVLIALVVIAALMILGPRIGGVFSNVNSSLSGIESISAVSTPIAPTSSVPPTAAAPPGHVAASGGVCPPGAHYYHVHMNGTTWCHLD